MVNNMKKAIAILLMISIIFILTACGNADSNVSHIDDGTRLVVHPEVSPDDEDSCKSIIPYQTLESKEVISHKDYLQGEYKGKFMPGNIKVRALGYQVIEQYGKLCIYFKFEYTNETKDDITIGNYTGGGSVTCFQNGIILEGYRGKNVKKEILAFPIKSSTIKPGVHIDTIYQLVGVLENLDDEIILEYDDKELVTFTINQ